MSAGRLGQRAGRLAGGCCQRPEPRAAVAGAPNRDTRPYRVGSWRRGPPTGWRDPPCLDWKAVRMIIFGSRSYSRVLATLLLICQRCGNPAAHRVMERVVRFTLFFLPLFPISTKRFLTCTFCGTTTPITKELAAQYVQQAGAPQHPAPQYPAPQPQHGEQPAQLHGGFPPQPPQQGYGSQL
jgi:zinc-ribbon family